MTTCQSSAETDTNHIIQAHIISVTVCTVRLQNILLNLLPMRGTMKSSARCVEQLLYATSVMSVCNQVWCQFQTILTWMCGVAATAESTLFRGTCYQSNSIISSGPFKQMVLFVRYDIPNWKSFFDRWAMQMLKIYMWTQDFHIVYHLLFWSSVGGATNSPPHVLYMGISYSSQHA